MYRKNDPSQSPFLDRNPMDTSTRMMEMDFHANDFSFLYLININTYTGVCTRQRDIPHIYDSKQIHLASIFI
jgi:hypothetical protein